MTGPEVITLGCRLNIAESEAIRQQLGGRDDLVVVNSCAVTGEAVRQTRQAIRRAHRTRPEARIVVTGCAAQTDPGMFAAMPEVTAVIGNGEKAAFAEHLRTSPFVSSEVEIRPGSSSGVSTSLDTNGGEIPSPERVRVADIMTLEHQAPHMLAAFAERVRAFVVVQNGCDHRCTFCIIPFGRGPSRSVPAGAVVDQVRALVDEGVQEIVLTGVDVTSYGPDLPGTPSLGLLVERILRHVPDLPRLRLSSLDGIEIDDRLFDLISGEPRLMPHVHLSLQAGDDMILKRMKRRHSRAQAVDLVERLHARRPEIAIGADIIAGFPTEDDAMFENSLALVRDCRIVHGHIFPYSPRDATPAARMPQLDRAVIRERAARLRAACEAERTVWLRALVGSTQSVLIETSGLIGHGESFASVRFATPQKPGEIVRARITGLEGNTLIAHGAEHG
ncbi:MULTISPECIES: tRNA (N(6)-L-threonylcarbamoyladenosine(37)-C(2))-methylthiotransferase MtaB [unclassified Sphingobium]|uniref:tRNA (N(6)-L-threonylcarbamoyladenosine(37)-C(2))- methylthiotransferase MtaB n=1 Tax=unclassified Sphingobium TaxID=2611147 RepID=UPI0022248602|nr:MULTISPECIES: tRNA (N(6)-L-threonylcarbamoyladenosine(37)-C(2))-methylthiotransferase MtaB [unclassified Sphingobium]MCW2350294.1 threonylcarbamoyladenosine tRNA methylthiotransferase MtaB [Sphingobium sp. B12D2B]MCW2369398.1 threonylcarbamoyladenosine tRNA methylthiotransferase MtaB [Sphingobium sp. B11D3D]